MIENLEPTEKENNLAIKIKATWFSFWYCYFFRIRSKVCIYPLYTVWVKYLCE